MKVNKAYLGSLAHSWIYVFDSLLVQHLLSDYAHICLTNSNLSFRQSLSNEFVNNSHSGIPSILLLIVTLQPLSRTFQRSPK